MRTSRSIFACPLDGTQSAAGLLCLSCVTIVLCLNRIAYEQPIVSRYANSRWSQNPRLASTMMSTPFAKIWCSRLITESSHSPQWFFSFARPCELTR